MTHCRITLSSLYAGITIDTLGGAGTWIVGSESGCPGISSNLAKEGRSGTSQTVRDGLESEAVRGQNGDPVG
ncbi:hypothetical protein GCM10028789_08240 [Sinomonas halotolerans]